MERRKLLKNGFWAFVGLQMPLRPDFRIEDVPADTILTHQQWLRGLNGASKENAQFLSDSKSIYRDVANMQRSGCDWIVRSSAYPEMYTRDAILNLFADLDPQYVENILAIFVNHQDSCGQIQTSISKEGNVARYDDESTLLFLILAAKAVQIGINVDERSLNLAKEFLISHISSDFSYQTLGQNTDNDRSTYHYWMDSLVLSNPASPTYVQGLASLALECCQKLGLTVDQRTIREVRKRYQACFATGPALGLGSDIWDVSALAPEALSLLLFDKPLLRSDSVLHAYREIASTASTTYPDGEFLGYKVLSKKGHYLAPEYFNPGPELNWVGSYQNGGSWLLWDSLAIYAAGRHGSMRAPTDMVARVKSDLRHSESPSNEFLLTTPNISSVVVNSRGNYGWNGLIASLI